MPRCAPLLASFRGYLPQLEQQFIARYAYTVSIVRMALLIPPRCLPLGCQPPAHTHPLPCPRSPFVVHLKPSITELVKEYQARGVRVVAISSNSVETHPQDGPDRMVRAWCWPAAAGRGEPAAAPSLVRSNSTNPKGVLLLLRHAAAGGI
jgi:hypothetical protein